MHFERRIFVFQKSMFTMYVYRQRQKRITKAPDSLDIPTIWSGYSGSKLTMSLVNVLFKIWSLFIVLTLIFLPKNVKCKATPIFSKNICELDILLTRTVNILTTNEHVKLMMFWTSGPWAFAVRLQEWMDESIPNYWRTKLYESAQFEHYVYRKFRTP